MQCVFCKIANKKIPVHTLYEDDAVMAFLDSDPIQEGHVLIIPKAHFLDVDELPEALLGRIMRLSQRVVTSLKKAYAPDGYSILQNGGACNDIGHYHLHIFPRHEKDGFGWNYPVQNCRADASVADKLSRFLRQIH